MFNSRLMLGLLVFWLVLPAAAQQEITSYRSLPTLTDISAARLEGETEDSAAWELTLGGVQGDACQFELHSEQALYPHNIDIQLYRQIPVDAVCPQQETPFETRLALEDDLAAPYLIVNSQVWEISYQDGAPRFAETQLLEVVVDEASLRLDEESGEYELTLQGSHAVGCELPVLYARRGMGASVLVGAFNAIDEDAVCPAMLLPLDETITLPATQTPADALFGVNAYIVSELESQNMSSIKVPTDIHSVTAEVSESFPMQIRLDVVGEHPDGCDYPVIIDQSRQGSIITVEVYREVPVDVICPMILQPYQSQIQLDGKFESGKYIIRVNNASRTIDI